MRKIVRIVIFLAIVGLLSFGCAGISKEAKIKCPKCGAVFTVDEGLTGVQMKGY